MTSVPTMPSKRTEVLVEKGNYYRWEFNKMLILARKDLLKHVTAVKDESDITATRFMNEAKALGIIAQGPTSIKIRPAKNVMEAWETLCGYYYRLNSAQSRSDDAMTYDLCVESGTSMAEYIDTFDELLGGLQKMKEQVDESWKLRGKETTDKAFRVNANSGNFGS
ncbi:uncharacterized protein PHALS_12758 [Plasmopara halstedii]|uniref:Uncharacterized protein n=1 Tax=Plasmopara halstedii TaxID=4781 RepID=A0A0P1ANT1_PLAHL|nr:uncharacterized protein PHALS_12758 [Plasmopara halstedii]CEG42488.1 hypothetical protein PHALS_12758 [Plasmopara halstedii]|eukprot:XP_024578857.1 hypothetical protein PHALS_12758 [Plasmopara halstedii]